MATGPAQPPWVDRRGRGAIGIQARRSASAHPLDALGPTPSRNHLGVELVVALTRCSTNQCRGPYCQRAPVIDGGRGLYFEDPNGHLHEIITRPYGSGGWNP